MKYIQGCLWGIVKQTRQPDMIVVSVSGVQKENEQYDFEHGDIPLTFLYTDQKHLEGGNRNRAARAAVDLGADILCFFDVDDIMHPRRIEMISKYFEENERVHFLLHSYMIGPREKLEVYGKDFQIPWIETENSIFTTNPLDFKIYRCNSIVKIDNKFELNKPYIGVGHMHNAHVSVRKECWLESPYNETFTYGNDSAFNYKLWTRGFRLGYSTMMLSCYMREDYDWFSHPPAH
jgi:cellulose synthase/poly-beta-1,6-N-acetylglucosamine synthase-like glycosyltransferase